MALEWTLIGLNQGLQGRKGQKGHIVGWQENTFLSSLTGLDVVLHIPTVETLVIVHIFLVMD